MRSKKTKYIFVTGGVVCSLGKGLASASHRGPPREPRPRHHPPQAGPVHQRRSGHDEPLPARRGLRHRRRRRDRHGPRPLRALHRRASMSRLEQLHHRPHLQLGHPEGAARRVPGQDGPGDSAHHRRDQGGHPRAPPRGTTRSSSRSAARWATSSRCPSSRRSGRCATTSGRENAVYIHLTLLPYIAAAGEVKTKPTQHSVMKLREIGIQPDILRLPDRPGDLPRRCKEKIAMFCNVDPGSVFTART